MKEIELTQGKITFVDDEDYERLMIYSWHSQKRERDEARARARINGEYVLMHRFLMNAKKGQMIDHIDGNPLNNQKVNLRFCTNRQNLQNRGPSKRNKLGVKGVDWVDRLQKYRAQIRIKDKHICIGWFNILEEAGRAYDKAARKYHGEFAYQNFPLEKDGRLGELEEVMSLDNNTKGREG